MSFSRRPPRRAFTLVETVLVLALLVVITGIVWPALDGPFAAERLRKAADQFRADLTQARVAAMSDGTARALLFDAASGRYAAAAIDDGAFSAAAPGTAAIVPAVAYFRPLPEGIFVQSLTAVDDVTPPPAGSATVAPTTAAAGAAGASTVYFHPDGTTSTAVVWLRNERGDVVRVDLRGLTGATAVGEPLRMEMQP